MAADVFIFSDPRDYLSEEITERKKQKGFRLARFAEDAGLKSASLLSMILSRKRALSPGVAGKLADALSLKGKRKKYFLALGRFHHGKSHSERADAQSEMLRLKASFETQLLTFQQYRFVSMWYYPAIYVMAGMQNMKWDPKWIALRLGRKVKMEEVRIALADLVKLGILEKTEDGYRRAILHPMTAEDTKSTAIFQYHRQMLNLALKALELPLEKREMNGLTVAISKEQIPVVKERVRAFRRDLDAYLSEFESKAEDVYQVNVQLFPLTELIREGEET